MDNSENHTGSKSASTVNDEDVSDHSNEYEPDAAALDSISEQTNPETCRAGIDGE